MIVYSSASQSECSDSEGEWLPPASQLARKTDDRMKNAIAYRFSEQKQHQKLARMLVEWRNYAMLEYRCKHLEAVRHHENNMLAKAFYGIMDYSMVSMSFRQKLVLFYYRHLTRKYFSSWNQAHQMGSLKENCHSFHKNKSVTVDHVLNLAEALEKTWDKLIFIELESIFIAIRKPKRQVSQTIGVGKATRTSRDEGSLPSRWGPMMNSRRQQMPSIDISQMQLNRSKRKLTPIVQQVHLPPPPKRKIASTNLEAKKLNECQQEHLTEVAVSSKSKIDAGSLLQFNKYQQHSTQPEIAELKKVETKKMNQKSRVLGILGKAKLLEMCLINSFEGGEALSLRKYIQATSECLERIRAA